MYEDRILAFLDILGFSEFIGTTIKDNKEDESKTKMIDNFFEETQEMINKKYHSENILSNTKSASHFSDSIVISYLVTEESGVFHLLADVLFLCVTALQKNFLLRGTIVQGKLYHKENRIFGPALITAAKMEKNMAIFPRIIFDDTILKIAEDFPAKWPSEKEQLRVIKKLILRDFDGLNFINYFDGINYVVGDNYGILVYLKALRNIIIKLREEMSDDLNLKSKYLWLKEKYNTVLNKYKKKNSKNKTESLELSEYLEVTTLL